MNAPTPIRPTQTPTIPCLCGGRMTLVKPQLGTHQGQSYDLYRCGLCKREAVEPTTRRPA